VIKKWKFELLKVNGNGVGGATLVKFRAVEDKGALSRKILTRSKKKELAFIDPRDEWERGCDRR